MSNTASMPLGGPYRYRGAACLSPPRTSPHTAFRGALLCVCLALLLVACGSDGAVPSSGGTPTPTPVPRPAGQFSLNISVVGSGRVTSMPGGIDCGADCAENYNT